MNDLNQKQELFKGIWKVAEDLRGKVDGWEFKSYFLCTLFYKYISQNIIDYLNNQEHNSGNKEFNYEFVNDSDIDDSLKNEIINEKGFFLYPSQLFNNVCLNAKDNLEDLNIQIANIFKAIQNSASGTRSEGNIRDIFMDVDFSSSKLGKTVLERNKLLLKILTSINELQLGSFNNNSIDVFGDAYEFLMGMYASKAGKSGGGIFHSTRS